MPKPLLLPPRLGLIASRVPAGAIAADIGTDHAYLPIYLVEQGICPRAFASDIRPGPLEIARSNLRARGLEGKIRLVLSDGLEKLEDTGADTLILAGMGGELIARILAGSPLAAGPGTLLILQPMTAEEELRSYLFNNGYVIPDEALCLERDKLYVVMTARKGTKSQADPLWIHVGKRLIEKKDPLRGPYLQKKLSGIKKALGGIAQSRNPDRRREAELLALCGRIEELLEKEG